MTDIVSEWSDAVEFQIEQEVIPSLLSWEVKETQKFTKAYTGVTSRFGYAIAMNQAGDVAIVSNINGQGILLGRIHHCVKTNGVWSVVASYTSLDLGVSAADVDGDGFFGGSLALSGDGTSLLIGCTSGTSRFVHCKLENGVWKAKKVYKSKSSNTNDGFGSALAMSADGTLALVGAPNMTVSTKASVGEVYVYSYDGTSWSYLKTISSPVAEPSRRFGYAVAISGNGVTAAIGCAGVTNNGFAHIFKQSGANWTLQQAVAFSDFDYQDPQDYILPKFTNQTTEGFAHALALNYTGTLMYAGMYANVSTDTIKGGGVFVFAKIDEKWRTGVKLYPSDPVYSDYFGYALATNAAGDQILVSAPYCDTGGTDVGGVYAYNTETFSNGLVEVEFFGQTTTGTMGQGVALSGDAGVALITDPTGAKARFYKKLNRNFSLLQTLALPTPAKKIGNSAALSADGSIALMGGVQSAEFYKRTGDVWEKLAAVIGSDMISTDLFGSSVALSADASIAAVGSFSSLADTPTGAVYMYARNGDVWVQTAKVVDPFVSKSLYFGRGVAMNAGATLLFVTADQYTSPAQTTLVPVVYVYAKVDGVWTYQQTIPCPVGTVPPDWYVACNKDASILLIGAAGELSSNGKRGGGVHLYTRVDQVYTLRRDFYLMEARVGDQMGPCAISGDNTAMLVGTPGFSTVGGAVLYINPSKF